MDKFIDRRLLRLFTVIFITIIITITIYILFVYSYPFFIAFIISSILHPIITKIETKWKLHRGLVTFFVIVIFFAVILIISYFFIKQLFVELTELTTKIPIYIKNISIFLEHIEQVYIVPIYEYISKSFNLQRWNDLLFSNLLLDKFRQNAISSIQQVIIVISQFLSSFAYTFLVLLFLVLATYFMTKDYETILSLLKRIIPTNLKIFSLKIKHYTKQSIFALMKAQISIAIITAIISFIGLFMLRVEHVLTFTIVILIIDLIPYAGIGILFIPWILYLFFTEQYIFTIQLSILYFLIIIVRQIIEPRLLAKNLGIHPLVTIIILFTSIKLFGALGFLMTPFLLILMSSLYHAKIIQHVIKYINEGYM